MGQTAGFAAGSWILRQAARVHPENPDNTVIDFDLETSDFSQVQGKQGFERGVVHYAAQSNPPIDAEIAEKGHFRTKAGYRRVPTGVYSRPKASATPA